MRKLLPPLLILGLLIPIQPASAIFGLSKCEKVKKEMLKIESDLVGLRQRGVGTINYKPEVLGDDIWVPDVKTLSITQKVISNDPLPKIWKLGTNNPKCYTNTQKLRIKQINNLSIRDYVVFTYESTIKQSGECKKYPSSPPYRPPFNEFGLPNAHIAGGLPIAVTKRELNSLKEYDLVIKQWHEKCNLGQVKTINYIADYKSIYNY